MISTEIKNTIRLEAILAERQGRLTDRQLELIYEFKWFHLLVPKDYGGQEMDLPNFALLMEELATIDGAFAWNVNLGAGANMFAGYMDSVQAKKLFEDPKTCIAGSGMVSGEARKVGDEFEVNGEWRYASGSAHATFFSLNAPLVDLDESVFSSFIVPADQVEVNQTWKTTGLKATSSHNFSVNKVRIPEHYSFSLLKPSPNHKGVLFQFSFQILAEINMLVMSTGLAMRFLELVNEVAMVKRDRRTGEILKDSSTFINIIEERENLFLQSRALVFVELSKLWEQSSRGESISSKQGEQFTRDVLICADAARTLVDSLSPFMGMDIVFEESALNRVWRDFKTASQHILLAP